MTRRFNPRRITGSLAAAVFIILFAIQTACAGEKVFMWKVVSPQATAYILGTMHMMKKEMYPLDTRIQNAFKQSDTYVMEFNINEVTPSQENMMLTDIAYAGNDTIRDHISGETFELARKKFEEYGLPFKMMEKFKPWFLAISLETLVYKKLGFDPRYGIDKYFLQRAEGVKKIVELESFDSQMELFRTMTEKEQELLLVYTLKEIGTAEKDMDKLAKAWADGDAGTMEALVSKNERNDARLSGLYEKLFYERNRNMADRIEDLLAKKGTYFIAVGAAHLVGDQGIIELLAHKGYSIEQQ